LNTVTTPTPISRAFLIASSMPITAAGWPRPAPASTRPATSVSITIFGRALTFSLPRCLKSS
jgi:hypothetical protein